MLIAQVSVSKLMRRRKYSEVEPTRCEQDPVMRVHSLHLPLLVEVGGERIHCGPKCPSYQSENLTFYVIKFDGSLNQNTQAGTLKNGKEMVTLMLHASIFIFSAEFALGKQSMCFCKMVLCNFRRKVDIDCPQLYSLSVIGFPV